MGSVGGEGGRGVGPEGGWGGGGRETKGLKTGVCGGARV